MARFFKFHSLAELETECHRLGLSLRFSDDLTPLFRPVRVGPFTAGNAFCVQPMEGCDGTLDGPDLRLYRQVLTLTDRPVIASGGVRTADDIWELRDVGCEAAVTGKALYEKTLKISQVTRG